MVCVTNVIVFWLILLYICSACGIIMQIKDTCTLLLTFIIVLVCQVSSKDLFSSDQVSTRNTYIIYICIVHIFAQFRLIRLWYIQIIDTQLREYNNRYLKKICHFCFYVKVFFSDSTVNSNDLTTGRLYECTSKAFINSHDIKNR